MRARPARAVHAVASASRMCGRRRICVRRHGAVTRVHARVRHTRCRRSFSASVSRGPGVTPSPPYAELPGQNVPGARATSRYIPRRSIIFGSRRHFERTLTTSSRNTGCPTRRSTSGRAREPISRTIAPFLPTRMPFCDSVSTSRNGPHDLVADLLDDDRDRVRHLVAGEVERLLADHLGDAVLGRQVGRLVEREVERPFREEVDEVVAQLPHAVLRHGAHRVQRVEVAERRRRLHLRRDVAVLEPVDLVERDDHRDPEREHAAGDVAVAGADPVARRDDEQDDVDVLERRVDRVLHPLGQRVHRALEAGQVGEHELPVGPVRDAEDPATGRVRDVRGDRDLVAAERVDERRLADVRSARDGDEARSHARSPASNCSGSSSSTVIRTSRPPLRNTTRSTCISASHCRQPPQGDAVIAATVKSPGR